MPEMQMSEVTAVFWDIGGVILSNGWDRAGRASAAHRFSIDADEFEKRHAQFGPTWERGEITQDEYLTQTVFDRPRSFTREEFASFIFAQSREFPESRAVLDRVARAKRYLVAALNNEAPELNRYRIERFDLRRDFTAFFSSCYLRARKPDAVIYSMALQITQRDAKECVFIDDRPENIVTARQLGLRTIRFENAEQLLVELARSGVTLNGK
jgi:putative hydrolase of the HAD superfamily